jgi:hypothetical protein
MSCWSKEELESMLEDVVNALDLSDEVIAQHGPLGTPPAELVKMVLRQKERAIRMLKSGMVDASETSELRYMSPGQVIALIERKNEEIKRLKAKSDEMFEVLENILAIMNESRGVAGWHLNGNIASWDELELRDAVASAIEKACDPE